MRALHRGAHRALRPAATLLAVLGVLAGLLGMHVLAADHAMAMPVPAAGVMAAAPVSAHAGTAGHAGTSAGAITAPCQAAPDCPGATMQAPCTPGGVPPQTVVPDPGTFALYGPAHPTGVPDGAAALQRPPARAPSLLELSVSRT